MFRDLSYHCQHVFSSKLATDPHFLWGGSMSDPAAALLGALGLLLSLLSAWWIYPLDV